MGPSAMTTPLLEADRFICFEPDCACHASDESPQNTPPSADKGHLRKRRATLSSEPSSEKSAFSLFDDDARYASSVSSVQDAPLSSSPPDNFGVVESDAIFRSAYPSPEHYPFLSKLHIKTILCLVDSELDASYSTWMKDNQVECIQIGLPGKRETAAHGVPAALCERALHVLQDPVHHPILIHCNHGKHRTGTLVACLRVRQQQWHVSRALDEYQRFAHPKERAADQTFIKSTAAALSCPEPVEEVNSLPAPHVSASIDIAAAPA